jgi:hypothetical protein
MLKFVDFVVNQEVKSLKMRDMNCIEISNLDNEEEKDC